MTPYGGRCEPCAFGKHRGCQARDCACWCGYHGEEPEQVLLAICGAVWEKRAERPEAMDRLLELVAAEMAK